MHKQKISIFWFRRDLRLEDNVGLTAALTAGVPVLAIFIFDKEILSKLPKDDARVTFIYETLQRLRERLKNEFSRSLAIYYGSPTTILTELSTTYDVQEVHTNRDYEPYARKRDSQIKNLLSKRGIRFTTYKDQVLFEENEIVKQDKTPYVVYTPFKNKWKSLFKATEMLQKHDSLNHLNALIVTTNLPDVSLSQMGFAASHIKVQEYITTPQLIDGYEDTRNFPAIENGTSHLGPHLRFGTVSIREITQKAIAHKNEVFWSELIWREFFMQILWHFPHTKDKAFRPKYDRIEWRNNEQEFEKWKKGETGYALVDAGIRELNATGFMHNRVRMLVASFLCKHLLIDWRWGEAYFAEKLLDYDMSANVGNWQWAAGSGVDAAPYFRIFNPITQVQKFDKQLAYIKKWIPDLQEFSYPPMMVDHKKARERCLQTYNEALA